LSDKSFIDLFAGCGGLSLGLENAGFSPVFVNELNKDALESYLTNRELDFPLLRDTRFHIANVKDMVSNINLVDSLASSLKKEHKIHIENGELDLITGGPPCQGYSGIGYRRSYSVDKKQLPSNHLYQDMAWVINKLQPKIFLFENVKGLLVSIWDKNGTKGEIFRDVLETFSSLKNYRVNYDLVCSKDYDVPQNRPRVLIVGVRDDVDISKWGSLGPAGGFLPDPTCNAPDLIDLLSDITNPEYVNGGEDNLYCSGIKNEIQKKIRTDRHGKIFSKGCPLTEQKYTKHSEKILDKFQYMIENNGNLKLEHKTKKFSQKLLPARWGEKGPNITVTSLPDDYVHYLQPRILTVREWARIQGFPDWYQFSGPRTTGGLRRAGNPQQGIFDRELPKYTQIGNSVPVWLAERIGNHFGKIL